MREELSAANKAYRQLRQRPATGAQPSVPFGSSDSAVGRMLTLQRTIGNRSVLRLVSSNALWGNSKIGYANDAVEPNTYRVAAQAMRRPSGPAIGSPVVQRQQESCGGEAPEEEAPETKEPDHFSYDPALDPELKKRFNRMVTELIRRKIGYGEKADLRTREKAHIVSTAYHIRQRGGISLADLRALPDGKDADANIWYKPEWETWASRNSGYLYFAPKVTDNAFALAKQQGKKFIAANGDISCAYEGYPSDDQHRVPNVPQVPISNHVLGLAIDLSGIEWDKLGGQWSKEANEFVAGFGLTRPFSPDAETYCIKEHWHFEMASGAPEEQPEPPAEKVEAITNTENVRLVKDPAHWDDESFILDRLAKGTHVEVRDEGAGKPFNKTEEKYQWWCVRASGKEGWVMKVLLDGAAGNP